MRAVFALVMMLAACACMTDARGLRCSKKPHLDKYSTWNTTPGNMRPLPCAPGWQTLDPKHPGDKALLDSFLAAEFVAAQVQLKRDTPAHREQFLCPAGVHTASFSGYFLACQAGDSVQAQGVVAYTCAGSKDVHKLGLIAEGTYAC